MYAIKIMSGENLADSDVGKGFKMIMVEAGDTFEFGHDPYTGQAKVDVTGWRAGEPVMATYPVTGNAYVLSEIGKTIASFWGRNKEPASPALTFDVAGDQPVCTGLGLGIDPSTTQIITEYAKKAFPEAWPKLKGDLHITIGKDHPDPKALVDEVQTLVNGLGLGVAFSDEAKDAPKRMDVTKMNRRERELRFRSNVASRMSNGESVQDAMAAEAYLIQ